MGFWDWISNATGLDGLEGKLVGWLEVAGGGVLCVMGGLYTAEAIGSGATTLALIPISVTAAGALVALDGIDRTGVWLWKDIASWDDVIYGWLLSGVELAGGVYLSYNAFNVLTSTAGQYQYKGVGYGMGFALAAGAGYLLWDGYDRYSKMSQFGHVISSTTDITENDTGLKRLEFWYKKRDDSKGFFFGDSYEAVCKAQKNAVWITSTDEPSIKLIRQGDKGVCLDKGSYMAWKANQANITKLFKEGNELAKIARDNDEKLHTNGGNTTDSFTKIFGKRFDQLTCREWFYINATPDNAAGNDVDNYLSRVPQECVDLAKKGGNLDIVPDWSKTAYSQSGNYDSVVGASNDFDWSGTILRNIGNTPWWRYPVGSAQSCALPDSLRGDRCPEEGNTRTTRDVDPIPSKRMRKDRSNTSFRQEMSKYSQGKSKPPVNSRGLKSKM